MTTKYIHYKYIQKVSSQSPFPAVHTNAFGNTSVTMTLSRLVECYTSDQERFLLPIAVFKLGKFINYIFFSFFHCCCGPFHLMTSMSKGRKTSHTNKWTKPEMDIENQCFLFTTNYKNRYRCSISCHQNYICYNWYLLSKSTNMSPLAGESSLYNTRRRLPMVTPRPPADLQSTTHTHSGNTLT